MQHADEKEGLLTAMYKHLRTGRIYIVLLHASDRHTEEEIVVFQSVKSGRIWTRPSHEFYDGRYEKLSDAQATQPVRTSQRSVETGSHWDSALPQYARR